MYVIANVGTNWQNSCDLKDLVRISKRAGADAVMFKYLNHYDLYGHIGRYDRTFPKEVLPDLYNLADRKGIDLLFTPYAARAVKVLNRYAKAWKIDSGNLLDFTLLREVAKTEKPVLLEVGGAHEIEIQQALTWLGSAYHKANDSLDVKKLVTILYTTRGSPSREQDLSFVSLLKEIFGHEVGVSDYSTDVFNTAVVAKELYGAPVFEKHIDMYFDRIISEDRCRSLDPDRFQMMTHRLKNGCPEKKTESEEEADFRLKERVTLVATAHVEPDQMFIFGENFAIHRAKEYANNMLSPDMKSEVHRNYSKAFLSPGDPIIKNHVHKRAYDPKKLRTT